MIPIYTITILKDCSVTILCSTGRKNISVSVPIPAIEMTAGVLCHRKKFSNNHVTFVEGNIKKAKQTPTA